MATTIKKGIELDVRVETIIREVYADYEKYLPMLQDRMMYRRKQNEYWDIIRARLKEDGLNGRADNAAANE